MPVKPCERATRQGFRGAKGDSVRKAVAKGSLAIWLLHITFEEDGYGAFRICPFPLFIIYSGGNTNVYD